MSLTRKYELYSSAFRRNAHNLYAQMRRDDPVFQQPGLDGKTPIWFVTRYEEVGKVLLDDKRFVRNPGSVFTPEEIIEKFGESDPQIDAMMNNNMLNRDGETHRRLRSLVSKAFTPKVIEGLRPRIEQIATDLLDQFADKECMELISDYAFPLPIIVIAELLGIPIDNREKFRTWSNAFVRPTTNAEEQRAAIQLLQEFAAYMQELVAERRQKPGADFLSRLIHVEEEGDRLNESELFSMFALLIVAGHETTVSLIGNAVLALLENPQTLQELRDEQGLIPIAVEELLRYDSPVERALARWVAEDVTLAGQPLKRGDLLIVIIGSANRDDARFDSPNVLDIHRRQNPHIAFGKGVHYCLGAPLARLEAEIALRVLLEYFPGIELGIQHQDLEWRDVPLFRSLTPLPVRWVINSDNAG